MTKFSYKTMVGKGLKYFLVFLAASLPFIDSLLPAEIKQLSLLDLLAYAAPMLKTITVGSVLVMALNWLKVRGGVKMP